MGFLFKRYVSVTVTKDGQNGKEFASSNIIDGQRKEGLRISFEVSKSNESNPNTAKINIWNLNNNSIGLIEEDGQRLILEVGYEGLSVLNRLTGKIEQIPTKEILSIGDIQHVETKRNGPDRITTIEIGDGEKALNDSKLDKSFPAGVTKKQVVDELIDSMGLVKGAITDITDKIFNKGISTTGKSKDQLDTILDSENLEMSVQDGEVQIIKKGGSIPYEAVLMSPENGLVGTPARKKGNDGVTFTSLLNPLIRPGRIIRLVSSAIQGDFITQKCTYIGDTNEGDFLCKAEAK